MTMYSGDSELDWLWRLNSRAETPGTVDSLGKRVCFRGLEINPYLVNLENLESVHICFVRIPLCGHYHARVSICS